MERLIELMDFHTLFKMSRDNTTLSLPRAAMDKWNTAVDVSGRFDSGTYGQRVFKYNRINLSFFMERQILWKSTDESTLDLLYKLNATPFFTYVLKDNEETVSRQGYLRASDIVDETFTMNVGQSKSITIKANPNSYMFIGALAVKLIA